MFSIVLLLLTYSYTVYMKHNSLRGKGLAQNIMLYFSHFIVKTYTFRPNLLHFPLLRMNLYDAIYVKTKIRYQIDTGW